MTDDEQPPADLLMRVLSSFDCDAYAQVAGARLAAEARHRIPALCSIPHSELADVLGAAAVEGVRAIADAAHLASVIDGPPPDAALDALARVVQIVRVAVAQLQPDPELDRYDRERSILSGLDLLSSIVESWDSEQMTGHA